MDEFLQGFWTFAGNYWWLIFPIMGVAGGIGKAWERASKQRHERRLETIRIKGEIKAAQIAARGQTQSVATQIPAKPQVTPNQLLEPLFAEHDEITARWLDY